MSDPTYSLRPIYNLLARIHAGASIAYAHFASSIVWLTTQVRLPLRLSFGFAICASFAIVIWGYVPAWLAMITGQLDLPRELVDEIARRGYDTEFANLRIAATFVAAICIVGAGISHSRSRLSLRLMHGAFVLFAFWWLWVLKLINAVPAAMHDYDYTLYSSTTRNDHWIALGGGWLLLSVVPLLLIIRLTAGSTIAAYTGDSPKRATLADRFLQSFTDGGDDPRFRSSRAWATALFAAIIIAPLLVRSCGMEEPYGLIKGQGEPAVQVVIKKKKKPKPKELIVANAWSPFIFEQPDIDDIKIKEELDEDTSDEYVADAAKAGNLGQGGPGKGGWPHGMMDGKIRFIRLEYAGGDWDQDMGQGADYNLLLRFREITGFKIADDTESLAVKRLRRFPKDRAPPFVFLTGERGMNFTSSEIETLRWYCLEEGGCLFIDNGGGTFHRAVTATLKRIFPRKQFVDIANDDPIFKAPFVFPNGAPPLWQHAGTRAKGIRHNGRWVVFYHPGDMNDAWKTGHSGASKEVAEQSYRLGINVMYYTFNQYHRIHFE